jgi:hypothetical protein
MKRITTLLMAFVAITAISFATPGNKFTSNNLMNAFLPNHLTGKSHTNSTINFKLNAINDINTSKQKLDSATAYGINFEEGIVIDMKVAFTYNTNGKIIKTTQNIFLTGTSMSIYATTNEFEYDQSGRLIENTETTAGQNSYNYEYTYNANNMIATETESYWDEELSDWAISNKYENEYNSKNKIITKLIYSYVMGDELGLSGKYEYHYNASEYLTEIMQYAFSEGYHKTGTEKYEYTKNNTLNNISAYRTELGENNEEILTPIGKREFTYDAANNRSMETSYTANDENGGLVITGRDVYKYNNDYSSDDLVLPFTPSDGDEAEFFTHMVVSSIMYSYNEGTLTDSIELKYYYSEFSGSSVFDSQFTSAQISPNPSSEYVSFNWESNELTLEVTIYDMSGQEVITETVTKGEGLPVNSLKTGAYVYKLKTADKILYGGKIVIL